MVVVDLYRRGCREPLPLFPRLSPALFESKGTSGAWSSDYGPRRRLGQVDPGGVRPRRPRAHHLTRPPGRRSTGSWAPIGPLGTPTSSGENSPRPPVAADEGDGVVTDIEIFEADRPTPTRPPGHRGQRRHRARRSRSRRSRRATSPRTPSRSRDLLIVTFTRAAAAELKDRVRDAARGFPRRAGRPGRSPTTRCSDRCCSSDRALRLHRVETAITEFDSATITTIHGFAQQVHRHARVDGADRPGRGAGRRRSTR